MHFFKISANEIATFKKKHGAQTWRFLLHATTNNSVQKHKEGTIFDQKKIGVLTNLRLQNAMRRMNNGLPLPLATKKIKFLNHWYQMRRGVFQPRVETEEVLSRAIDQWITSKFCNKGFEQNMHNTKRIEHDSNNPSPQQETALPPPLLLDLCCGSGVMGISALLEAWEHQQKHNAENGIAKHNSTIPLHSKTTTTFPLYVVGVDINKKAVRLSRKNAKRLLPKHLQNNYLVMHANILSKNFLWKLTNFCKHKHLVNFKEIETKNVLDNANIYDRNCTIANYILCNPPYIPENKNFLRVHPLSKEVLQYDPHEALFGGDDGLVFYKRLAQLAKQLLSPTGEMVLELEDSNAVEIANIFKAFKTSKINDSKGNENENLFTTKILNDMFGKKRIAFVKRNF